MRAGTQEKTRSCVELTEQGRARQSVTTHSGAKKKKGGSLGLGGNLAPSLFTHRKVKIFIFFPPSFSLLPFLLRPFCSSSERSVLLAVFSFFSSFRVSFTSSFGYISGCRCSCYCNVCTVLCRYHMVVFLPSCCSDCCCFWLCGGRQIFVAASLRNSLRLILCPEIG